MYITKRLFELQDLDFKAKTTPVVATIDEDRIIGVRMPKIKALAKELLEDNKNIDGVNAFLSCLPHKFMEEYTLHGIIIANFDDYDKVVVELNKLLPYLNSWALTDAISPKVFKKYTEKLKDEIYKWLDSEKEYTVRFAIVMAMRFCIDNLDEGLLERIASISSDKYYINMAIAWYMCDVLIKKWDKGIRYLQTNSLNVWVHNKTIQKCIDSFRIADDKKQYLRTLRIKSR